MSIPSYPLHSFSLKLLNKGMNFPFPPLKLPNKGRGKYSKIILFILFNSILFHPLKRGLKAELISYCQTHFQTKKQPTSIKLILCKHPLLLR